MRGTRWLLLAAILAILGGTAFTYYVQRRTNVAHAAPKPPEIPQGLSATAEDWQWERADAGKPIVKIRARGFRQVSDTDHFQLEDVRMDLTQKDGAHFDLVKSPKADFNQTEQKLISDGEVEIVLSVPVGGQPTPDLTSIKSTGITFETKSGKATTDRATSFRFQGGTGTSVGASYDPATKELHLLKQVILNLKGKKPGAKSMRVETDELTYKETGSVIWLTPKARLASEHSVIDAGPTLITLKDQAIDSIAAHDAHGVDTYPKRKLDYSADMLIAKYNDEGHIEKISGMGKPRLLSVSEGANTTMAADLVDLDFTFQNNESTLTHAVGNGHAVIESRELPDPPKRQRTPENRILRAAYIDMYMRTGGKEIEKVLTQTPGSLEFLPNEPDQHRRLLNGDKMTIVYGKDNSIQSFATTKVSTETYPSQLERDKNAKSAKPGQPPPPPPAVSKTSSVNMTADFDEKSQMKHMKQWDAFTYEEGDRRARALTATLDNDKNLMDLDVKARIWDASGSTDADHIQIDQKTGNYIANGHVSTSRLPDKDKDQSSANLLDGDQPIQGRADHMTSANKNQLVHYDGNAILWQGSDRVQADQIDIDRTKHTLIADGKVITQLIDKQNADDPAPPTPAFTVVKAPHLVYADETRLAHYTGGALMNRPGLWVKGAEIRAFLSEKKDDNDDSEDDNGSKSRLDKAVTEGDVEIVDSTPLRKRTGTGLHAEYYTGNERIILRGNLALLVDSLKGTSQGSELIYTTGDQKLEVQKTPEKQVKSRIKRKAK